MDLPRATLGACRISIGASGSRTSARASTQRTKTHESRCSKSSVMLHGAPAFVGLPARCGILRIWGIDQEPIVHCLNDDAEAMWGRAGRGRDALAAIGKHALGKLL